MSRVINMTEEKPARLMLMFAFPVVLTNLGQQLYQIVDAAIVGRGAGVAALQLPQVLHYQLPLDMAQRMVTSLDRIKDIPVTVHLGNHPYNNHTLEKRERQLNEGGNPFVDTASWPEFMEEMRKKSLQIVEENAEMARKYQIEL